MLARIAIITTLLVVATTASQACVCGRWNGPFAKASAALPLIVRASVVDYGKPLNGNVGVDVTIYETMTVQISKVIQGENSNKTIIIHGDHGNLCRPYITSERFPLHAEFLFATTQPENGQTELSVCGEYWIRIEDGAAHGITREDGVSMTYRLSIEDLLNEERMARSGQFDVVESDLDEPLPAIEDFQMMTGSWTGVYRQLDFADNETFLEFPTRLECGAPSSSIGMRFWRKIPNSKTTQFNTYIWINQTTKRLEYQNEFHAIKSVEHSPQGTNLVITARGHDGGRNAEICRTFLITTDTLNIRKEVRYLSDPSAEFFTRSKYVLTRTSEK